jgi:phosphoribosyl-ATP pyrophosphohydrolase
MDPLRLPLTGVKIKMFPSTFVSGELAGKVRRNVGTQARPLDELERTIADRAAKPSEKSYTTKLLSGGVEAIGAKIVEESMEVVEAAGEPGEEGREHFVREVGDLVYHLMVLMRHRNCSLADVEAELNRRFGVSGLDEKAARKK